MRRPLGRTRRCRRLSQPRYGTASRSPRCGPSGWLPWCCAPPAHQRAAQRPLQPGLRVPLTWSATTSNTPGALGPGARAGHPVRAAGEVVRKSRRRHHRPRRLPAPPPSDLGHPFRRHGRQRLRRHHSGPRPNHRALGVGAPAARGPAASRPARRTRRPQTRTASLGRHGPNNTVAAPTRTRPSPSLYLTRMTVVAVVLGTAEHDVSCPL